MRSHLSYAIRIAFFALGIVNLVAGCGGQNEEPISGRFVSVTPGAALRHLVLEGTPTSMGRAEGRLLRDEIRAAAGRPLPEGLRLSLMEYAHSMRPLAPAALLEELDAMAQEAGVSAGELFLQEAAHEGLRWHEMAGAPRSASFASVPGASSDVVVAFDGADVAWNDWIVVERRPREGVATLVLSRAGEIGAIGGVTRSGLVLVGSEIDLPPERRTLRGPPFSWSLRAVLEGSAGAETAIGRIASLCGHRVLAADGANHRSLGLVTLAANPPKSFDANAWVLAAAGADDDSRVRAQEDRLAAYASRPGANDAVELALAGRTRGAAGPVARWTKAGLRFQAFDYAWSGD